MIIIIIGVYYILRES